MPEIEIFLPEDFINVAKRYEVNHIETSSTRYVTYQFNKVGEMILLKERKEPPNGYHTFELVININSESITESIDRAINIARELTVNGFQIRDESLVICALYWYDKQWFLDIRNHSYKNELTKYQRNRLNLVDLPCRV